VQKLLAIVVLVAGLVGVAVARADDHPDSKTQPVVDGCNRSQLALLAEGGVGLTDVAHPTVFPSWVYVDGDNTPKTLEGTVKGAHTAGTDLFGVHKTYDANFDVTPDPGFESLLSTRNAEEDPPQVHTEYESGLLPLWAWPSPGDHVRETGSFIWDCGHWQGASRKYSNSDYLPTDPLATIGQEEVGGEAAEIHPIQELATWRRQSSLTGAGAGAASQLDVFLSNQGGKAKAVMECALSSPTHATAAAARIAAGQGCSQLQKIAGKDYTYVLKAPEPKPAADSVLRVRSIPRTSKHAPADVVTRVVGDRVQVTVPFHDVPEAKDLQEFGATVLAYWSSPTAPAAPTRLFKVTVDGLKVFNNLDGDIGQNGSNPSVDAPGEWNMFLDVAGQWTSVHKAVPQLAKVPNAKPNGVALDVSKLAPTYVAVPDTASSDLRLFVDARECDLPGYTDCPANELDFGQFPGRAELVRPVSSLAGTTTTIALHPPVCPSDSGCPEENSKPSQCPVGCWQMDFTVEDITPAPGGAGAVPVAVAIVGDGTSAGTWVNGVLGGLLPTWRDPVTRYGPDQDEEHAVIEQAVRAAQRSSPR
jgi:hypothetical protein